MINEYRDLEIHQNLYTDTKYITKEILLRYNNIYAYTYIYIMNLRIRIVTKTFQKKSHLQQ